MNYNLIIYDDNEKLRQSLQDLLSETKEFTVKATYSNCDKSVENIQEHYVDLIIMDIDMPGIGGIKGVTAIKEFFPEIKIVMHTVFDDDERIFDSICAGADGYLLKNTAPLKLIQYLNDLMEGGSSMSPFIAQRVLSHFRESREVKNDYQLTKRELEILGWLVKGYSYKMIANECGVTADTIKKHLQNIYHKLQVNCATEAVAMAIIKKIVRLD